MYHLARFIVYSVALIALLTSANADAASKTKRLLQHIPADTPYVFAITEPLPDDLVDKLEPAVNEALSAYQRIVRYAMAEQLVTLAGQEDGAEQAAQLQAFIDELTGLMSVDGLHAAGFGRDSLYAVYGDGLLPVMRIGLDDPAKFDEAVARLASAAAAELPAASLRGKSYRYIEVDKDLRLIIATLDGDAVITLVPSAYTEDRLAQTLGLTKPRNNLARSKTLRKIARAYGFTNHSVGFVDIERIAASFLGDPGGHNAKFLQLIKYDSDALSDQCRSEFASLAAIAPRIVMGYTALNGDFIDTGMIVELRDDIAAGLATLPAAVPGLGVDTGGLFSFGFGVDLMAARTFYEARLDAMEADPYECAALAELQASTVKGREALARPLPPVVYGLRGFLASVAELEGMDIAAGKPPESIDAGVLVAVENAQDLASMAALMSPDFAALNLVPDGKARPMNLPDLANLAGQAFAALSEGALSISFGTDAETEAEAMLRAPAADPAPFISTSFDAKRYYGFIGQAIMQGDASGKREPAPLAIRTAMRDAMVAIGDAYERMLLNVHLTTRGIEMASHISLAEQPETRE